MRVWMLFLILALPLSGKNFDELMGKSTSHWSYVTQESDLETVAFAKSLYEKNQEAELTPEGPYKIPPVIHFIWLGPRPFPPESVENVRSWISQNPGCAVKFWTDRDRDPPCEGMERVLVQSYPFFKLGRYFEESRNWGEKSDLLRYEILFREGGLYVDHDVKCLISLEGLLRGYDFVSCLETPHEPFVGRSVTCGNAVIGSRPGHPAMEKVLALVAERWDPLAEKFRGNDPYSQIEVVMQRTYIALTDSIKESLGKESNRDIVFPAAYFFAKSGIAPIYAEHYFVTAWDEFKARKTKNEKFEEQTLGKIKRKNRLIAYIVLAMAGSNVLLASALLKKRKT